MLIAGQMVAWLAQISSEARGYGLLPDMGLGLVGSVFAGTLVWVAIPADASMLGMLAIGGSGALLAIVA